MSEDNTPENNTPESTVERRQESRVFRMGDEENFLEKLLFNNRVIWLIVFGALTIFFLQLLYRSSRCAWRTCNKHKSLDW